MYPGSKRVFHVPTIFISVKLTFSLGIFGSLGTEGAKKLEARGGDLGRVTRVGDRGRGDGDRGLFRLDEAGSEGAGRLCLQMSTCLS